MDTKDYIREAHRQLNDDNFYVRKDSDLTPTHLEKIGDILTEMKDNLEIDYETYVYLLPHISEVRTSRFYFLPKIHKKEVKGRPIISGNGCPTERISAFVDDHIKDFVKKLPSYVRDTSDFIKKLETFQTQNEIILVTLDVTSLYTNIPNHEGILAVIKTLEPTYNKRVSLQSIKKLLTAVLHMNNFEFNGKHYLQIGGTAMGTKVAPSYANLFMGKLEDKLLSEAKKMGLKPALYLRFIDDIFVIWDQGEENLKRFINFLNESHDSIKFTAEYSKNSVTFLDTKIHVENNDIYTELYTKETDTHNYLHYTSAHPKHCKKGGPYGEFLRIRRNCQKIEDYDRHSELRVSDYRRRGYPIEDLIKAQKRAREMDRQSLLRKTNKKEKKTRMSNSIPLIVTYNPANPNLHKIIEKYWPLIQRSKYKDAFKEKPLISYRRNKNIANHIIRAKCTTEKQHKEKITPPCKKPWMCQFCPRRNPVNRFKSTVTERTYTGPSKYTCRSTNLIYLITCQKCGKQYVGETKREFRIRMNEHLRYIKTKNFDQATGRHFNLSDHKISDFSCKVIFIMREQNKNIDDKRLLKEEFFIDQLKTREPNGLNDKNGRQKVYTT